MNTNKKILELFSFFREATPGTRQEMSSAGRMVTLQQGATYIADGSRTDIIALVGDGNLRVFKTSESGREITFYGVGPGEFCMLNLLCVLTGICAPASARVEETVTAVVFNGDDFRRWIGTEPSIRNHVFAMLTSSVAETMSLVEEIAFKKMDVRLAGYLCSHMPSGAVDGAHLDTTHEAISLELGSAREVISRLLKEFERQGAVTLSRGCITVKDAGLLREFSLGS